MCGGSDTRLSEDTGTSRAGGGTGQQGKSECRRSETVLRERVWDVIRDEDGKRRGPSTVADAGRHHANVGKSGGVVEREYCERGR